MYYCGDVILCLCWQPFPQINYWMQISEVSLYSSFQAFIVIENAYHATFDNNFSSIKTDRGELYIQFAEECIVLRV